MNISLKEQLRYLVLQRYILLNIFFNIYFQYCLKWSGGFRPSRRDLLFAYRPVKHFFAFNLEKRTAAQLLLAFLILLVKSSEDLTGLLLQKEV